AIPLVVGDTDLSDFKHWEPAKVETSPTDLAEVYAKLPARFPRLFERMVLSYRWAEVDLGTYTLLANPPGPDLTGLLRQISKDPGLWEALIPAGSIQFGKGPDLDYDPVCFDIKTRKQGGDCRIVKIDHEEILCNNRVKVVAELAPSFYPLVLQTIQRAKQRSSSEPD
ncbi:MAG: hypothetical protein WCE73_17365, partial [Candidatus Angelobacter sp.]